LSERCCEQQKTEIVNGYWVCKNCGMIFGICPVVQEKRMYTNEDVRKRKVHEPIFSRKKYGPRTLINPSERDINGFKIQKKDGGLLYRMRKINSSFNSSLERNLSVAEPILKALVGQLNLPNYIQETAWLIYHEIAKQKLTMGRTIDGFISASLYAAIRIYNNYTSFDDLCEVSGGSKKEIYRHLKIVRKESLPKLRLSYKPINPINLIFRFGNNLNVPLSGQKIAVVLLNRALADGFDLRGKDPKGIAGAALYIAMKNSHLSITQSKISATARITATTLRGQIKKIKNRIRHENWNEILRNVDSEYYKMIKKSH